MQSLEQLAQQTRINYTVVNNSDIHEYFLNMKYAEDTIHRSASFYNPMQLFICVFFKDVEGIGPQCIT